MASPASFYHRTQGWLRFLGASAWVVILLGAIWGLLFAPADYQQGDAFRIIYVHVPAAFLSIGLYMMMAFCSLLLIVWRIKLAGIFITQAAKIGFLMTLIALITGSIWGKPMWGAWWVWDARLTSELILLMIYASILMVGSSFKSTEDGDKIIAILTLVGLIDIPIIHYSVYWWNTLHQGSTLSVFAKPKIATPMLYPLLISIGGFILYTAWLLLTQVRNELLSRERGQRWVRTMLLEVPK